MFEYLVLTEFLSPIKIVNIKEFVFSAVLIGNKQCVTNEVILLGLFLNTYSREFPYEN